ncbi:GNAT family N-acetyltransferase [Denitrobaculum tricleocarpae]|uniref:GNAT family N-acetyltransferase n=1 Tax=Denitrobaculum tricleocarpae TaxID=2591009 RepID=A0A545TKU5_9PROT|nr:GNAT family N-acetyltransferase [Denitrobaculum tricleocarpae]TQV77816.1 GNAT family N-acetyltransferase [Denitrobaculum tricleocarpae]
MSDLQTAHLSLRRPRLSHVPALFRFLGNPDAMRHTHVDLTLRDCRRRIAVHERFRRRDGCAPWTVAEKASGGIIGWGGLYHDPFDRRWGVEVGYAFHPDVWGRGYATELVTASLKLADEVLALPEVWAFAQPDNAGSRRVLEKTGFAEIRFVPEMGRILYRREGVA